MLKTNGRFGRPQKLTAKEVSALRDKQYRCPKCNYIIILDETEFGQTYGCPNCDGIMEEVSFS